MLDAREHQIAHHLAAAAATGAGLPGDDLAIMVSHGSSGGNLFCWTSDHRVCNKTQLAIR